MGACLLPEIPESQGRVPDCFLERGRLEKSSGAVWRVIFLMIVYMKNGCDDQQPFLISFPGIIQPVHSLHPVVHVQFAVDISQMFGHGMRADVDAVGHFFYDQAS